MIHESLVGIPLSDMIAPSFFAVMFVSLLFAWMGWPPWRWDTWFEEEEE